MLMFISIVDRIFWLAQLIILAKVLVSWFLAPYHPVRATLDRIVEPFLVPIRRMMPPTGMMDFSAMVLLILLWILQALVISILRTLL